VHCQCIASVFPVSCQSIGRLGSQTTGTMDNWYHAIFDTGGQLGPSSYVKVDNWYHQVFPEWTTGTMFFFYMGGQLGPFPILLIYWYHLSSTGVDNSPIIWVTQLSPIVRRTIQSTGIITICKML